MSETVWCFLSIYFCTEDRREEQGVTTDLLALLSWVQNCPFFLIKTLTSTYVVFKGMA